MRTVIATPLYPPDIGGAAPYVKELARRLSENHAVTIVAYGHLPEQVPGVSIVSVDKRRPLPLRLFYFTFALLKAVRNADILFAENGPSVELPVGVVTFFVQKPLLIHIGDKAAHAYARKHFLRRNIENFAFHRANKVIEELPLEKPETLPFGSIPVSALETYGEPWNKHIDILERIFAHAGT